MQKRSQLRVTLKIPYHSDKKMRALLSQEGDILYFWLSSRHFKTFKKPHLLYFIQRKESIHDLKFEADLRQCLFPLKNVFVHDALPEEVFDLALQGVLLDAAEQAEVVVADGQRAVHGAERKALMMDDDKSG